MLNCGKYVQFVENKEQLPAKPIILLSGPPGAGKTTVAGELITISKGPMACIEGDKFWSFFAKDWENAEPGKNFKTLMISTITASLAYARAGYEVILDFSVPPWFLPAAYKIINDRGLTLHYIVLRPGREICAQRTAARVEGAVADYSRFGELYDSFDEATLYLISDNESSAAIVAAKIREGLDRGIFRVKG